MQRSIINKIARQQRCRTTYHGTAHGRLASNATTAASNHDPAVTPNSTFKGSQTIPFYGLPQPPGRQRLSTSIKSVLQIGSTIQNHWSMWSAQRHTVAAFLQQSFTAIRDPTRADAVAAVSEMTGRYQLRHLLQRMQAHPVGRQILRERPVVSKATLQHDDLMEQARRVKNEYGTVASIPEDQLTFGIAYGLFLLEHGFDPDERDDVKYLSDEEEDIAYVMLRFRQCHDYWHVLTQLPPTVNGEIGLKLLELFHMQMPVAALSCLSQSAVIVWKDATTPARVDDDDDHIMTTRATTSTDDWHTIWNLYLPWARRQARNMEAANVSLLNVYYEHEFSVPLHVLRQRLQLQPYQ